ncbi:hypothetical protein GP486_003699 [Trichoglossum hirsutum]|uniref:Kinetochore protein n=1 Tax=Trichoglossum hirsutum TaxID=265104 RepID=A0A9P8RQB3_9PEZI|nr:hypothetical protein GP486_003699 [Trichoglossum hirsutum]
MSLEETIVSLKKRFIASQVRLLNGSLRPSRDWQENAPRTEHGDLNERAVVEALYRLNSLARHHNLTAYSSHAQRHVAEQIEALYWNAGEVDRAIMIDDALDRGVDLRRPEYEELYDTLTSLSEKIHAQRQKVAQFKRLQELLEPFENPQESVQPNIVTRDGELGKELDRMRILMARVAGRVGELEGRPNGENEEDAEVKGETIQEKLQGIVGA